MELARETSSTRPLSPEALPPSDADLIAASRTGDATAYDTLYRRHASAARRLARQLMRGQAGADDVVAETFAKILDLLRRGGGPEGAFRPYLLTAVRRAAYDRHRAERRQVVSDNMEPYDPGVPFADPAVADLERTMIARAFASLPERWQAVLWHTEIEGARPAEVATLLGLKANGVAALAYRAREGQRQAYLQTHVSDAARPECRPVAGKLGAYIRGGLAKRDAAAVAGHLDQCADCRRLYAELDDVNVAMRTVVAPVVLGAAAAAYLAAGGPGSAAGWVAARLGQAARQLARGQQAAVAAAAAATVTLVAAAVAMGGHPRSVPEAATSRPAPAAVATPCPIIKGTSAPVLPAPARAALPEIRPRHSQAHAPAVAPAAPGRPSSASGVPQTLSQPTQPVADPSPSDSITANPATPPATVVVSGPNPPLVAQTIPVEPSALGGTSILRISLTLPVVGVQVSANVSLPGRISLGVGGAPGTTSEENWTSAG